MADTKLVGDGTAGKPICTCFVEGSAFRVRVQKIDFTTCVLSWGYTASLGANVNFAAATVGETVLFDATATVSKGQTVYYNILVDTTAQWASPRTLKIPRDEEHFRIVCAFDSHLYGDNVSGDTVVNEDNLATVTGIMQSNLAVPLVGINALAPDFVLFGGDETECQFKIIPSAIMNNALLTSLQSVTKPIYSLEGNHEGDNGAYWIGGYTDESSVSCNQTRAKYLMHPTANGVPARYGYVDIGNARLIFLNPIAYTSAVATYPDTNPKKAFTLGATQLSFLQSALNGTQRYSLIFIHHLLSGRPQLDSSGAYDADNGSYGWGGLGLGMTPPAYTLDDEIVPLLNKTSRIVFQGHSQVYCREKVPVHNGSVVYTAPSAGGLPMGAVIAPSANNHNNATYFGFTAQSPKHYHEFANAEGEGGLLCIDVYPSQVTVTLCDMDGDTVVASGRLINPTTIYHNHDEGQGWMG